MGNSSYYVYGRSAETDLWLSKPILSNSKSLLNKFKHMVYSFALHRRYKNCKALYLYRNRERLIKAELVQPKTSERITMILTFETEDVLKEYNEAEEQLLNYEISFLERIFKNRFGAPMKDPDCATKFNYKSNKPAQNGK